MLPADTGVRLYLLFLLSFPYEEVVIYVIRLTSNNISSENENRKVSLKNMCLINESREISL
jgi:hypothetical protein